MENFLLCCYSWIADHRDAHENLIFQRIRRAITIPRPPLESSWRGESRLSGYIFLWSYLTSSFFKQVKAWPQHLCRSMKRPLLATFWFPFTSWSPILAPCLSFWVLLCEQESFYFVTLTCTCFHAWCPLETKNETLHGGNTQIKTTQGKTGTWL